jgi:hypothetical protein
MLLNCPNQDYADSSQPAGQVTPTSPRPRNRAGGGGAAHVCADRRPLAAPLRRSHGTFGRGFALDVLRSPQARPRGEGSKWPESGPARPAFLCPRYLRGNRNAVSTQRGKQERVGFARQHGTAVRRAGSPRGHAVEHDRTIPDIYASHCSQRLVTAKHNCHCKPNGWEAPVA